MSKLETIGSTIVKIMTNTKKSIRLCPICNSNNAELLHNQRFELSEEHVLPNDYDVVACTKCGFVYADTKATQKAYDKFYKDLSKYEDASIASGTGSNQLDAKRIRRAISDITKHISDKNKSILDIGCANGGLLAELRRNGYKNVVGLDPSPACVDHIQNEHQIEAHLGSLFNANHLFTNQQFDVVILSHVLEHIVDIEQAYEKALSLMSGSGQIYIEVPDASRYSDYYVVPFFYFDCEHINHFDLGALSNLAFKHGLDRVAENQIEIIASDTNVYPALYGIYRKNQKNDRQILVYSSRARESVFEYIKLSKKRDEWPLLEDLVSSQEEIVVWGAGSFAQRMLQSSPLSKCNITAFIDNDSNKQGKMLHGVPIRSSDVLNETNAAILICSALHSNEIANEIKTMGVNNNIFELKKGNVNVSQF